MVGEARVRRRTQEQKSEGNLMPKPYTIPGKRKRERNPVT